MLGHDLTDALGGGVGDELGTLGDEQQHALAGGKVGEVLLAVLRVIQTGHGRTITSIRNSKT